MDWKNKPNQIFNKVKQQMYAKGVESFYWVDGHIQQFDQDNSGQLTPHFFNLFLNKVGVFLSTQQIRNIKDLYSHNNQTICYRQFLEDVKYSFSEKVRDMINHVYTIFDANNDGFVKLSDLLNSYNPQKHPQVLTRRKTPQQAFQFFSNGITRKSSGDKITRQNFTDYYAQLNFCVPNQRQDYLIQLLKGTWNIVYSDDYVSPQRLHQIQLILYEKIRQKSDGKTNEWKCAKKALHFFDLDDSGKCDLNQFRRALDKFGCNFKNHQSKALFDKFDINKSGTLEYDEFAKIIMDIDINGMISKTNLLTTLGQNHFKVTH